MLLSERGKILPAYGRRLMKLRFAGEHPLFVSLLLGENWWTPGHEPFTRNTAWLGMRPRDYVRGYMDFRCVAGASVTVFDLDGKAGEFETPIGSPAQPFRNAFFDLLADLAQLSGPLLFVTPAEIYTHPPGKSPCEVWASRYAFECKLSDPGRSWPWWWSESLDKLHGEKIDAWLTAARNRAGGTRHRRRAA